MHGDVRMFRDFLKFCDNVTIDVLKKAKKRGCEGIISLIIVSSVKASETVKKKNAKEKIETGKADIFKLIPRDTEYDYNTNVKLEMISTVLTGKPVAYEELLCKLVVPKAHVGKLLEEKGKEVWANCPSRCKQKESCSNLREVYSIAMMIKEELQKCKHPQLGLIFDGLEMELIGSMKEGTKIFRNDELDIHTSLPHSQLRNITFDPKNQTVCLNGFQFPCWDYVVFYFKCLLDILQKIEILLFEF